MAKHWYPVIDYVSCISCGSCTDKCTHGVYDTEKAPSAHVIFPDGCVDQCHGCGNLCPSGSITYNGDATGWVPPNQQRV
ncbi:4Fe-4S dicluster domain-containing protein [Acetobacterium malicum]|uniref:4Fe-4S ferredoxin n=1 Tax=Acetobacterium malicum TaxID=52692 RepID=A0ABR6YVW7_9FIRM|nr:MULTISPECIES: 4Fe-4S ferredoxin [Acetobacterium]MBC3899340.1 4Fe-4S ferredoxin [Acetobacterium malicum]